MTKSRKQREEERLAEERFLTEIDAMPPDEFARLLAGLWTGVANDLAEIAAAKNRRKMN